MAPRGKSTKAKAPKTFDDSALTQLTASIEKKLVGKPDWENKKPQHGGKRKRTDGPATDNPNNEPLPKKRPTRKGPSDRIKGHQPQTKPAKTPASTLLEEIRALGGDENDLELIENVDSDAEDGDAPKQAKDAEVEVDDIFKNELAKFAASLGLEKLREEVEAESEAEAEEDEVEAPEAEDEEEIEEDEEELEEEPQPPARQERPEPTAREERINEKYGKLVSKHLLQSFPHSELHD